jgi:hypothetical protein
MNKLLLSSLLLISTNTLALTSFDPAKGTLTFDRYANAGKVYKDVVVQISAAKVLSQGGFTLTQNTPCEETFTITQYNQIAIGQTGTQVMDILGCGYKAAESTASTDGLTALATFETSGNILQTVKVNFNLATKTVVAGGDGKTFKGKSGF